MMPMNYTLDTLPTLNNPAEKLRNAPGRTVVAAWFSLYASKKRIEKKTAALLSYMKRDGLSPISKPRIVQYNASFSNPSSGEMNSS